MKTVLLIVLITIIGSYKTIAQSKKELESQISVLTAKIETLTAEVSLLKEQFKSCDDEIKKVRMNLTDAQKEIQQLKEQVKSKNESTIVVGSPNQNKTEKQQSEKRCMAITSTGNQCSRSVDEGSNYCWQHKKTYEPSKSNEDSKESNSNGNVIQTGPRGGKYYINSKGKKVYIKK
jgi:colicin import membrane protein